MIDAVIAARLATGGAPGFEAQGATLQETLAGALSF